jgi:hypothetical protein
MATVSSSSASASASASSSASASPLPSVPAPALDDASRERLDALLARLTALLQDSDSAATDAAQELAALLDRLPVPTTRARALRRAADSASRFDFDGALDWLRDDARDARAAEAGLPADSKSDSKSDNEIDSETGGDPRSSGSSA